MMKQSCNGINTRLPALARSPHAHYDPTIPEPEHLGEASMSMIAKLGLVVAASVLTILDSTGECAARQPSEPTQGPWLRINQVGYLPGDPKIALLSSDQPLDGLFQVADLSASIGPDHGKWGPFSHNYRLDFSSLRKPGRYRIRFGTVESPSFSIGTDAYVAVPGALIEFMKMQRCGDNPVTGKKCHQQDAVDTTTGQKVDL